MIATRPALALAATLLAATPAWPAASDWATMEGGAVRLVLSSGPDAQGRLRGALQVALEPGWKTYWREPGGSGIPPLIAITANGRPVATSVSFPAPQRHDEDGDMWAGYDGPVAFALTLEPPAAPTTLDASVFLGVCRDICIPVQAHFHIAMAAASSQPDEEAVLAAAFAALPEEPRPGLRLTAARIDGAELVLEGEAPDGAELFLAADAGPVLGTPARQDSAPALFRAPLLAEMPQGATRLVYTLTAGTQAVTGTLVVGR